SVEMQSLKGTYTGDCKKGKANGKEKAVGVDTYEGEFRSGLPDGEGTYTWNNGDIFKGHFVKGVRDGKGAFTFKRANATDSIVEGYWKKGDYIGKYEKPYTIYFKSAMVTELDMDYKKDNFDQITIFVSNTSGGSSTINGDLPKMKVDDVQLVSGRIGRTMTNYNHPKKTETTISNVTYPVRMKIIMGRESIEVEFREPGSYTADVYINQ
ncbi:MAG TPA: hypothetical protein VET23_15435, partial [Chitinophagaceae bacterium]|nr:hypothetical protein [Chitinophagaceae bacterium]